MACIGALILISKTILQIYNLLIITEPSFLAPYSLVTHRLKTFYKRFGFVENKGRNKDFSYRDSMYRLPQISQDIPLFSRAATKDSPAYLDLTKENLEYTNEWAKNETENTSRLVLPFITRMPIDDFLMLTSDKTIFQLIKSEKPKNVDVMGDTVALNSHNCLVKAESRLVAVVGVDELAVIESKDAILVVPLDQVQQVKELVGELEGRKELIHQREVYRPWGSYDIVESGHNYQVKRISVSPGAKLSLQRHKYRAEHWVVVSGLATVHLDGSEHSLKTNESIYIGVGAIHSLANNTNDPLQMIEVQSGSYLGEDDIERFEDLYGRC